MSDERRPKVLLADIDHDAHMRDVLADAQEYKREVASLTRERDEARRFLKEAGDEMRARWNAINESLAENRRLQGALEAIAEYEMDWTVGADANLARVQAIAEGAIRPPEADPSSTPAKHECPSCDLDDSVKVPPGKLLASTPIRKPGAPQGENARTMCASWCGSEATNAMHIDVALYCTGEVGHRDFCTEACRDAGKPLAPPGPSSRRPARLSRADIQALAWTYPERCRTGIRGGIYAIEDIINEAIEADRRSR